MPMYKDFGVVYSLTCTAQYEKELWYSIKQLKKFQPHWSITVFYSGHLSKKIGTEGVNLIEVHSQNPFIAKVEAVYRSPYKRTLFIDTDVVIRNTCEKLLNSLNEKDMYVPMRPKVNWGKKKLETLTNTRHSTGIILYKDNENVKTFVKDWLKKVKWFQQNKDNLTSEYGDQPLFNNLVQEKRKNNTLDLDIGTLDNTVFNVIAPVYKTLSKRAKRAVLFIHCHKFYEVNVRLAFENPKLAKILYPLK